ncbi:molybdenum ABC transporter ATP-binding protein [Tautonia rosea]|uniref:molybdenum ABC transporter ATP-binding protein n=1 Tax=Tautonia rosea TaxID=2728037 RepID=UPI0014746247|nr:ATP-binding cassette domain-containing protein [Tautonia rosea]
MRHRVHPGLVLDATVTVGREVVVLFGRSGAGKTTLLRLIAGLDQPDEGRVRLGGRLLLDRHTRVCEPLRRRRIGMIFQDDRLFPHLSVAGNLRFGLAGWPRRDAQGRLAEVAALCGVDALLDRRPSTLSGGERQRVALARALAPRPELLLCDEPFSALDLDARDALVDRLRRIQRREGVPVLYVTHSPAEASRLGDRLLLLDGGRIVAEGPPGDLLSRRFSLRDDGNGTTRADSQTNTLRGIVTGHEEHSTRLLLDGGPDLIVPKVNHPIGAEVVVSVGADEIDLLLGPVAGLSARNLIPGEVERCVPLGALTEVIVTTGAVRWSVRITTEATDALALQPGLAVRMIVRARSVRVGTEGSQDGF